MTGHCQLICNLVTAVIFTSFKLEALLSQSVPMGLCYPRCITLHFSSLNFTKFLLSQSLNFSCFHGIKVPSSAVSDTLPSLITPANLLRVHCVSGGGWTLAKSLMEIESNRSPSIEVLTLGLVHFLSVYNHVLRYWLPTLWTWGFSHISTHSTVCFFSLRFLNFQMRMLWENVDKKPC